MESAFNVNKLKVEHKDTHDLTVHASGGLDIRILQHIIDVVCVDFNDQVPNA